MKLQLVRRWGSHPAGETVDVTDTEGTWLVGIGHAVKPGQEDSIGEGSGRVYPGENGPDPRAGGDPSRLRMTSEVKSPREGERAGRVAGAPRASGDVTHVADENLGGLNKKARNDVPLASGKLLTEELDERQEQLEDDEKRRQGGPKDSSAKSARKASGEAQGSDESCGASPDSTGRKLTQPAKK